MIDHVLLPAERIDTVAYCKIPDDHVLNVSRHRPIICGLNIPLTDFASENASISTHIAWHKLDEQTMRAYESELSNTLLSKSNALDIRARERIDMRHNIIIESITIASDLTLPKTKFRPYLKPYWDRALKDLHAAMREKRRVWVREGRPRGRNYVSYNEYKSSKRLFRAHHRACAERFLLELNAEIDQAAEVDSNLFWKKVNSRRHKSHSHTGSEIKFGDNVCREPEDIVSGWGCYFKKLYSENENPYYDRLFEVQVNSKVESIKREFLSTCEANAICITSDDVRKAAQRLKRKKACGIDGIFNEHLINGGNMLYNQLSLLYTDMYNYGYIPDSLKKGIIITIHKGGRKSKLDPNNYRAVTLSSSILKLFERILLNLAESALNVPLNIMQGGFRANISCNMSSIMLRECILFAKENHSKLYVCFLDVQKAFDKVWHNGLFVKLYEKGIKSNLLRTIIDLHNDMKSCVLYNGNYSDWFPVLQGTRQGGVLSPFLYLCYIDGLINELLHCSSGFKMCSKSLCAPTVADDMLLMSLSKVGLDVLMEICFRYSCKWRYQYGPPKSSVIVFGETKYQLQRARRIWYLGPHIIQEGENYRYLGTSCDKYMSLKASVKEASDKIKGIFVSLMNSGIVSDTGLHPLSCQKIYKSVVLPSALYGCESWNNLTESQILTLERAHRYCIKYMQGLPRQTRTDIALSLLGVYTIQSEIDFKKLILFGQFCRLSFDHWLRFVFLNRLTSFSMKGDNQLGFIPDINKLLYKYGLSHVLEFYKSDNVFPSKFSWKKW